MRDPTIVTRERAVRCLALLFGLALGLFAPQASAQSIIKHPGDHPNYAVELEPHFVAQYDRTPYGNGGFGVGFRASIPFVHNGPIPKINNNIGISFGVDWVHFADDDYCDGRGDPYFYPTACGGSDLWFPVTGQWNFFLTPIISVFGEFGLAIHNERWSYEAACAGCSYHYSHLDFFEPVAFVGGRFLFGKTVGLTVRLGWPYISIGASFLL
jgi:hypothetical protein